MTLTKSLSSLHVELRYRCSCFAEFCVVSPRPMCPQASIYDDTSLYGSGYNSRAVSPMNVCQTTLRRRLPPSVSLLIPSDPLIRSPLNTAGTPLEPAPPAAALWWAPSPCMSTNVSHVHTHTLNTPSPGPDFPCLIPAIGIVLKSGNGHFPLQLCRYHFVVFEVPTVASFVILVWIARNSFSCVLTAEHWF